MNNSVKKTFLAFAAIACAAITSYAAPAKAVVIAGTGDDFTIDWVLAANQSDNDGGVTVPGTLSATASFDVAIFTSTQIKFNIVFENTTTLPQSTLTQARVTAFGIGVTPNPTSATFADDADGGFTGGEVQSPNQNFPGGFSNIDVCIKSGTACSGSGGGVDAGGSDSFMLTIFGDFSAGSVVLDPFPIKFQTNLGSLEFGGQIRVPEPTTLMLFGAGLLGLGAIARRRRRAA